MNKPYELTAQEWAELAAMKEVLEAWGLRMRRIRPRG